MYDLEEGFCRKATMAFNHGNFYPIKTTVNMIHDALFHCWQSPTGSRGFWKTSEPRKKKQTIRYFPWNTGYLMMGSLCHMLYEWNPHITGEFFIPLQISKTTMDPFFALQKSVQG